MGDLNLDLDMSELIKLGDDLRKLETDIKQEVGKLGAQTHAHIIEQAQIKLHSRRDTFVQNLAFEQINDYTYVVTVRQPAVWIEDGMPEHEMVDDLLRQANSKSKPAKLAKDGSRYRVIPFKQNEGPTSQTPAEQSLTATVKKTLKDMKIPYGSIERDEKGRPKTGLLHNLKYPGPGLEKAVKPEGIGQRPGNLHGYGHGASGQPMQGSTGIPFLQGIRIYQQAVLNKDGSPKLNKKGLGMATRSIMTFRIVSSKHKGTGKWMYPGIEGAHFLDEAFDWAKREWEEKIVPDLMKRIGAE